LARNGGKKLSSFGDVADINNNNNNNVNVNTNVNTNIGDLINKSAAKQMKGIYFDPDVAAALDDLGKQGRGVLSKVVNEATKKYLQENGLL
jgi:hypothetical protein